eukprot:TRINITY_DN764_c0_g1_i1.p2 TRINITY_DN764_c0_g1~~TRINITY_DN764_c0_g1_i1.p2  ORF type:complete len:123 (-),score=42.93 TRINITY_DN764_c0_g1_i1:294-662(-)
MRRQEIEYMRNTTILVTGPGASGFGGMFLPDNAAGVVADICTEISTGEFYCSKMDGYWWNALPHVRFFHYRMNDQKQYTWDGSFNVSFPEFDRAMAQAMEAVGMADGVWSVPPHELRSGVEA